MSEQTQQAEMTLDQYREVYSDFYKDAYGCRPRGIAIMSWTVEDFRKEFDRLGRICESNRMEEAASEAKAVIDFESKVAKLLTLGAKDRATAIKWIAQSEEVGDDMEYLCYKLGLPYRYFANEG